MRNTKKGVAGVILLAFLLSISLAGCSAQDTATDTDKDAEPIVVCLAGGDWGFPNPFAHFPRKWGSYYTDFVFDTLLYKDESGIIPWLAADWEILDEGQKYVFDLRKDVKWQDGEKFNADDVVFTFDYYREKNNPLYNIGTVKEVNKINDYKVELVMTEPVLISTDKVFTSVNIIPEHIWKNVEDPKKFHSVDTEKATIGTGPFILVDYQKEHGTYHFKRNEDFWGGLPRVAEIKSVPTSEPVLSLLNGDIAIAEISEQDMVALKDKSEFTIMESVPYRTQWLSFNLTNPILGNTKFRHAVAYAVDQQEVLDRICMGKGIIASQGVVPELHPSYNPKVTKYPYDPEKAGAILDELGYKDKDANGIRKDKNGNLLKFQVVTAGGTVRSAELIKNQLEKVGIGIEIKTNETAKIDELVKSGQFQIILQFGGMQQFAGDADYLRYYFTAPDERSLFTPYGYENARLTELGEKQRVETDNEKRRAMIDEMQKILSDEIPNFYICGDSIYTAYNKDIYDGWFYAAGSSLPDVSKLVYTREKKV